mgnify:CR=1 FL=1
MGNFRMRRRGLGDDQRSTFLLRILADSNEQTEPTESTPCTLSGYGWDSRHSRLTRRYVRTSADGSAS